MVKTAEVSFQGFIQHRMVDNNVLKTLKLLLIRQFSIKHQVCHL